MVTETDNPQIVPDIDEDGNVLMALDFRRYTTPDGSGTSIVVEPGGVTTDKQGRTRGLLIVSAVDIETELVAELLHAALSGVQFYAADPNTSEPENEVIPSVENAANVLGAAGVFDETEEPKS